MRLIAATLGLGAAFALAGCGSGSVAGKGDVTHGKELFLKNGSKPACASCHTLADAGSTAKVGPDLDTAFAFARVAANKGDRFCDNTIENVVLDQIRFAQGKMPPMLVKGKNAQVVAAYVASVAGTGTAAPTGGKITATDGKSVFAQAGCGSCHTLKDAGSTGTVGPNLDQLKPPEPRVVTQVTNGGAQMPAFKGRLTPAQIQAVAKYVSSVAGK